MMAMRRKNTCAPVGPLDMNQPWFTANVKRQRKRAKLSSASRRINRKRKGK